MKNESNINRRRFLSATAITIAASQLGIIAFASANGALIEKVDAQVSSETMFEFGAIKQVKAGLLNVGYAEVGPSEGETVILLHGWPYSIYSFEKAADILAQKGYHVLIPHLRGHGSTTFLSADTLRNGQQSAVALDIIAFMDALKIKKAILGGFDWGARTVNILAALWPERFKGMVSVSGYLIGSPAGNKAPLPPKAELAWWYQFYFSTERGALGYKQNTKDFNELIWKTASPKWKFNDATFQRASSVFNNPDHAEIVIHNYRWRLGLAEGESKYDQYEKRLASGPDINIPTITMEGDANGAPHGLPKDYPKKFKSKYEHIDLTGGIGHNLPEEAPNEFAQAIMKVATTS